LCKSSIARLITHNCAIVIAMTDRAAAHQNISPAEHVMLDAGFHTQGHTPGLHQESRLKVT
jgi:hypothetical protein